MMKNKGIKPYLVFCDGEGNIYEDENFYAAGRNGTEFYPLFSEKLIELPSGSDFFILPRRNPVAFAKDGSLKIIKNKTAVAAFLAPAYTQTLLAAYKNKKDAPVLPLFAYTAIGWYGGKFYVPATHIDYDRRQDPLSFNQKKIIKNGREILTMFPRNRLIKHVVEDCAFTYFCPAARNFILGRYEAPLPTSPYCNSRCLGCISFQQKPHSPISCTQPRINFIPTATEIAEMAVFHLERAKNPIVSFGQGCEGEPLLVGEVILESIKMIRKNTSKGVINLNTNGSLYGMVEKLFQSGLDSIRVSMNSVIPKFYERYYQPKNYTFSDVIETLMVGRRYNKWVSINYFVMPGMTDSMEEYEELRKIIKTTKINMIQWRNFNIDPDWYFDHLGIKGPLSGMGILTLMEKLKREFPFLYYGYFNPPEKLIKAHLNLAV